MRIVSLNAWGGAMYEPLAEWIPRCGADVLCLQEVTRTPGSGGWTSFTDGERDLPQRANLFDDVRSLLPRHLASFVASDAGPVVDRDGERSQQDFGIALWVAEHLPVVAHAAGHVHGSFVDHVEWAVSERPRVAHGVRLIDRTARRTVTVLHLHGLRDASGKHDTPARRRQAERVVSLVERLRCPDDLTVVCGDLNLLPDSETFEMLAQIGLADLVRTADTRTSRYGKPLRHADYLLVSDPTAVRRFEIVADPEVSDHRALVLDI